MISSGYTHAGGTARNGRFQFEALGRTQVQRRGCARPATEYSASRAGNYAQILAVFDQELTVARWIRGGRILAPLPGVAVQVKQSVFVRHLLAHRLGATVG